MENEKYFASEKDAILFYLLKLDGRHRNRLLGITDEHYESMEKADEWKECIVRVINNNEPSNEDEEALLKLDKIYKNLIR